MKTALRIALLALSCSAMAQKPAAAPKAEASKAAVQAPKPPTYAELQAQVEALTQANRNVYSQLLKAKLDLSTFKEQQLLKDKAAADAERRSVTQAIEEQAPGMHWDDRAGGLIKNESEPPPAGTPPPTPPGTGTPSAPQPTTPASPTPEKK